MKFYVIKSNKRCWTNKAGREALGISARQSASITHGSNTARCELARAPKAAAKVMRAAYAAFGVHGIALDQYTLASLNAKPGDIVQVSNMAITTVQRVSNEPKPERAQSNTTGADSLKNRIKGMAVGGKLTVTASQAKSGAYSVAKQLGYKVRKAGALLIERVS